jgi:hypothetical protein
VILNDVQSGNEPRKARKRIGRGTGLGSRQDCWTWAQGLLQSLWIFSSSLVFRAGRCLCSAEWRSEASATTSLLLSVAVINVGELNECLRGWCGITPELLVGKGLFEARLKNLRFWVMAS